MKNAAGGNRISYLVVFKHDVFERYIPDLVGFVKCVVIVHFTFDDGAFYTFYGLAENAAFDRRLVIVM